MLDNVWRVFDVVEFFHPISCGCDDGCEVYVVLKDCFHKQGQFVGAVQSCELSKHLDITKVFFEWACVAAVPLCLEREGCGHSLLRGSVGNVLTVLADCW